MKMYSTATHAGRVRQAQDVSIGLLTFAIG
jgi:hypothetical protein